MNDLGDIRDWIVSRTRVDLRRVVIRLATGSDVAAQLVKLRTLVPTLEKQPPRDLLKRAKGTDGIDLGIIPGREAWKLQECLRPEGFTLDVTDASYISYHARRQGANPVGVLIDDEDDATAFCLDLIARGCIFEDHLAET